MKRHTVQIIEKALLHWEDTGFLMKTLFDLTGGTQFAEELPVTRWRDYRDHLMTATTEGSCFDAERFLDEDGFSRGGDYYGMLPFALWQWTAAFRKVFEIGIDLQALLRHTVLRNTFDPEDIRFPFESFLLLLKSPISGVAADLKKEYVGILVFPVDPDFSENGEKIGILLLSEAFLSYRNLGPHGRDRLRRRAKKTPHKTVMKISRLLEERKLYGEAVLFGATLPQLIDQASETGSDYVIPEIARIIIGFALYLQMLPPGSPHRSEWQRPKISRPDPKAIVNDADICTVTSIHRLTTEEREHLLSDSVTTGREVGVHRRRGYFRRKRGQGQNPFAPRVEWVRPTLVRKDRLRPGELPGGSIARCT